MSTSPTVDSVIAGFIERLRQGPLVRIVGFGSSNTERGPHCEGAHNWLDWVDVGLRMRYGQVHHTINAGIGGDTSDGLIARFDRDVASYQPQCVFLTIGGNDACRGMKDAQFRENILALVDRVEALPGPCALILQTYYSCDLARMETDQGERFLRFMQIMRDVAKERGTGLIDNLTRWEVLRTRFLQEYREMMRDSMHLKPRGNMVWGADVCRILGAPLDPEVFPMLSEALKLQNRMDALA